VATELDAASMRERLKLGGGRPLRLPDGAKGCEWPGEATKGEEIGVGERKTRH
jgi:hypothetical protein